MIVTFLYLTQTEEHTKMSADPAITTLIIAATYTAVVGISESPLIKVTSGSPFNPAAAAGIGAAILFQGNIKNTKHTWVYLIFSYVGSLLAVFLFEFVYKKAMQNVEDPTHDSDDDERQEHDDHLLPQGTAQ